MSPTPGMAGGSGEYSPRAMGHRYGWMTGAMTGALGWMGGHRCHIPHQSPQVDHLRWPAPILRSGPSAPMSE